MTPRDITTHKCPGLNDALRVVAMDEAGPGGACAHYRVLIEGKPATAQPGDADWPGCVLDYLMFQSGPMEPGRPWGISNESVLAIVIDRLEGFQAGPFPDPHNEAALLAIHAALDHLHERTRERIALGIEGQAIK
jgi:hypothetical protein